MNRAQGVLSRIWFIVLERIINVHSMGLGALNSHRGYQKFDILQGILNQVQYSSSQNGCCCTLNSLLVSNI